MLAPTPIKLTGKEFEEFILDAADRAEKAGIFCMDRYGVEVSNFGGEIRAVPSKPDFEGTRADGRHYIIEAKVDSKATFEMEPKKIKPRQIKHLLKRSRFGSKCFLLLHWNERILKKSHDQAFTVAIPVNDDEPRWQKFLDAYAESKRTKQPMAIQDRISRPESEVMGRVIDWIIPEGCRKATPNLIPIIWPELHQIKLTAEIEQQTELFKNQ
jgi:hypothetical protein